MSSDTDRVVSSHHTLPTLGQEHRPPGPEIATALPALLIKPRRLSSHHLGRLQRHGLPAAGSQHTTQQLGQSIQAQQPLARTRRSICKHAV
jgi:hypothetical protein